MKTCRKCETLFDTPNCLVCQKRMHADWYARNKAKERAAQAQYYVEHRSDIIAAVKIYRELNLERVSLGVSRYYQTHKAAAIAAAARWNARNPEARRIIFQNRRARLTGGKLSRDIGKTLYEKQKGLCACCGLSLQEGYHIDHIMPLSLGGANEDWNVQLLTAQCNLRKGRLHPEVYARKQREAAI